MNRNPIYILVFTGLLLLLFSGCSTTKRLNDNQYLLVKNKITVTNPTKEFDNKDLESLVIQKPNKRFLGIIPFGLWINSIFKKAGQLPVALDQSLIAESKDQMRQYLNNSGFYNSKIEHEIDFKKQKARKVNYIITLADPYRIKNYRYQIADSAIYQLVREDSARSPVKPGKIFNTFTLDNERNRITKKLNDSGYFGFTKQYIFYEADSSLENRKVDLSLNIREYIPVDPETGDVMEPGDHKVYYLGNITVNPDFIPFSNDSVPLDTMAVEMKVKDPDTTDLFRLTYHEPLKIRPKLIARSLFLKRNNKYNETDAEQSYKKLSEIRIFKYVDIKFSPGTYFSDSTPERNYLDCHINITRNPVHSYSIEAQGTNSGGDLGIGGYLVYQNKNIFRGGEILYIRLKGAVEAQESSSTPEAEERKLFFFNTFEAGIEANLYIPKFLAPISQEVFSKYFRPKTTVKLGYNIQDRIEYDRVITNASFGYEWSENRFRSHILSPIDVNLIKVNTTPEFDTLLAGESERFRNQYTDNLILGLQYSFIFNNQELNRIKNFYYLRFNVEPSGNLLNTAINAFGQEKNEGGFRTVFGIRYSQYIKSDIDFRYYIMLDKKHSIATRGFIGVAKPYGNSIDIPFEKGYFGGGANGLRAWPLRYLGPGSYVKPTDRPEDIERVGDIMIEANFEYRFPIYRFFTGAIFYDVGNIWLISENETFPGGKFEFQNFAGELAMDAGIGIRLDFNYFIFRIDFAQRLKDPALPKYNRWVPGSGNWFKPVTNLGIGYPF